MEVVMNMVTDKIKALTTVSQKDGASGQTYPEVRWIWENPNAKEDIMIGNPVYVLLNKAGGYRRGRVVLRNLQVFDVVFEEEKPILSMNSTTSILRYPIIVNQLEFLPPIHLVEIQTNYTRLRYLIFR